MDYLRKTVDSSELSSVFDLPVELRNRKVEVIILPLESGRGKKPHIKSAKGCLKKYANPTLISEESGAWARAAEEKYADR